MTDAAFRSAPAGGQGGDGSGPVSSSADPAAAPPLGDLDGPAEPLPEPVRTRIVALAADALGRLPDDEVPAGLRAFRRFTAARRARLAGTPIAAVLEQDPAFRQRVADMVRAGLPDLAAALDAGSPPPVADPLDVAALGYLLRPSGWPALVSAASAQIARKAAASQSTAAGAAVTRLQEQLTAARAQARLDLDRLRAELDASRTEVAELRRELKQARDAARRAEAAADTARAAMEDERSAAAAAAGAVDAQLRRVRGQLAASEAAAETARRSAREGRALADTRVRLLVETLVDAAQGLRRELALPPGTLRPADVVDAVEPVAAGVEVVPRALPADDPALLDQLLTLPQVHLVVDGYNVTKAGYGSLPLEAQRQRLLTGLGSLAAQAGVEVTCCFDGAELVAPVVAAAPRGVRVLFSRPGETADELIRRLVRQEPPGRPVVVVSSDGEVVEEAGRAGARPLPAAALLRRLERG